MVQTEIPEVLLSLESKDYVHEPVPRCVLPALELPRVDLNQSYGPCKPAWIQGEYTMNMAPDAPGKQRICQLSEAIFILAALPLVPFFCDRV